MTSRQALDAGGRQSTGPVSNQVLDHPPCPTGCKIKAKDPGKQVSPKHRTDISVDL